MNKSELVEAIAKETKLTKVDADKALKALINAVTKSLKKGDKVTIPGFVTISKVKRKARTGRNPRTGKDLKIAAKNVAKLKACKTKKDALK